MNHDVAQRSRGRDGTFRRAACPVLWINSSAAPHAHVTLVGERGDALGVALQLAPLHLGSHASVLNFFRTPRNRVDHQPGHETGELRFDRYRAGVALAGDRRGWELV
jgi:hypothetical protein